MTKLLSRFLTRRDGNVAVIFSLASMPLVMMAGAALDYSRAGDAQSRLQAATDATVLSLCQADQTLSTATLKTQAQAQVQAYITDSTITVDDPVVTNTPRTVTLKANTTYPTVFIKATGQTSVKIGAVASCSANETYFEIALVMDTTGSMANTDAAGVSKMTSAKTAATSFINFMYSTGALPGHVKMSLVPFAASVAVDPATYKTASWVDTTAKSSLHWQYLSGTTSQGFTSRLSIFNKLKTVNASWDWKGCLESLPYPLNVQDAAPSAANGDSYFLPLFAPDEVSNTKTCSFFGYTYACQDTTANNSYLDDGTGSTGSCKNGDPTQTRFTQACKYTTPTNIRTTEEGPNWMCNSRPLTRLGATQATLLSEVNLLSAAGNTNIHEGLMWGWRTISPLSVFSTDAAAYGAANTKKVIVLMTDGANTWNASSSVVGKSYYSAYGYYKNANGTAANTRLPSANANLATDSDARNAIDALTLEGCTAAKARNVVVYTIGFSTPGDAIDTQGLNLLASCSSGSGYNFVANDSASLIAAFNKIGSGIGQLRLTN